MTERTHDNPGVIAPPPLIYGGALVLGIVLHALIPVALLPSDVRVIGLVLVVLSLIPGPWALFEMLRARTSPMPEHPTTAIVASGPFRFTRNPIYLTFTLFYAGAALLLNSLWLALLLIPVLWLISTGVIAREERYLEAKFGDEYRQYRARVRRWI